MFESAISKGAAVCAALLLLGGALAVMTTSSGSRKSSDGRFSRDRIELVTSGGVRQIEAEIAVSPAEQAMGLMYRTSLADDHGMLFLHPKPQEVSMWMHNTYISLDMVFIRADGVVHRIEARCEPLSDRVIASEGPVTGVLELAGGAAGRLGLKPGDTVRHSHFANTRR